MKSGTDFKLMITRHEYKIARISSSLVNKPAIMCLAKKTKTAMAIKNSKQNEKICFYWALASFTLFSPIAAPYMAEKICWKPIGNIIKSMLSEVMIV